MDRYVIVQTPVNRQGDDVSVISVVWYHWREAYDARNAYLEENPCDDFEVFRLVPDESVTDADMDCRDEVTDVDLDYREPTHTTKYP